MKRWLCAAAWIAASVIVSPAVFAVGTIAGTDIDNIATVQFEIQGNVVQQNSNTLTVTVAEILDVDVTLQSPQTPVSAGDVNQSLAFLLTNIGNGTESFALAIDSALAGDDFDPVPSVPSIYFDTAGSGDLSAGDTPYNPGVNDPVLAPDGSVTMLIANDIPGVQVDGDIGRSEMSAASTTGTGNPGDVFPNAGDGGVDAVVGNSGGADAEFGEYIVSDVNITAVKTATVLDPFGGTEPVPGAQVSYQVVVTATGSGTATNSVFSDLIPVNTTYVPGSITLNGNPLTDAPDADAGEFIGGANPAVRVDLGNLDQAAGPQTIAFSVTID